MSSATLVSFRSQVLAWGDAPDDERLFQRVSRAVLATTVLLCLLLLVSPKPEVDRTQPEALPPRLAKLLLEHEPPPKPEPKPSVADPAKPEVAQPEAPAKAELKLPPVSKLEPVQRRPEPRDAAKDEPDAREPVANKPSGEVEAARRKVAGMGLLAAREDIAQAREAPAAVQLRTDIQPGKGVGSGKGAGVGAGNEAGLPSRALITSNATGGSGGINTAGLSRNTGGGGLAGRATTLVDGTTGGGGGGGGNGSGDRGHAANVAGAGAGGGGAGGSVKRGNSGKASRSLEDIKLVFERNKGAIYAIYNRALREDPALQGKVVVELKISPAGSVIEARVVSSELHTPELEAKLLARIRQFDFGAKEVDQMNVTWPVDFLPS
jgi:TonB family protein